MSDRDTPSDDELIAGIVAGDREEFAALYRRRRPDVYRFALYMSGSHATAEDVVQDVFVAVIEQAARYVPGRSGVIPWLLGIARNHVRRGQANRRRQGFGRQEAWPHRSDGFGGQASDVDPVRNLSQQEDAVAVRRLIAELPIRYREAVVLCDLRELSYEDAAAVLRCAVGTVRSRLHRGRALLAARLRKNESLFRIPATGLIV